MVTCLELPHVLLQATSIEPDLHTWQFRLRVGQGADAVESADESADTRDPRVVEFALPVHPKHEMILKWMFSMQAASDAAAETISGIAFEAAKLQTFF